MDDGTIVLLAYLLILLPMLSIMILLQYDGMFQLNHQTLTRMIEVLPEDDKNLAYGIRSKIIKAFKWLFGPFFVWVNICGIALYVLIYVINIDDPSLIVVSSQIAAGGMVVISVIGMVNFFRTSRRGLEYLQWKAILNKYNIFLEDHANNPDLEVHGKFNKLYILARSWFRNQYPEISIHDLPSAPHRLFSFTEKWFKDNIKSLDINNLTRDLKLTKLWIKNYNFPLLIALTVMAIGDFFLLVRSIYGYSNGLLSTWIPNNDLLFIILFLILMILTVPIAWIIRVNELYNNKTAKKILDLHHIIYSDDTFENELAKLIDKHFPYIAIYS